MNRSDCFFCTCKKILVSFLTVLFILFILPGNSTMATIAPHSSTPSVVVSLSYRGWKYFEATGVASSVYPVLSNGFEYVKPGTSEWVKVECKTVSASFSEWILSDTSGLIELRAYITYQKPTEKPKTVTSGSIVFSMREPPEIVFSYRDLTASSVTVSIDVDAKGNNISYLWIHRSRAGHGVDCSSLLATDITGTWHDEYAFATWNALAPATEYYIFPYFRTYDQHMNDEDGIAAPGITVTSLPDPTPTPSAAAAATPSPSSRPSPTPTTAATSASTTASISTTAVEPSETSETRVVTESTASLATTTTRHSAVSESTSASIAQSQTSANTSSPEDDNGRKGAKNSLLTVFLVIISAALTGIIILLLVNKKNTGSVRRNQ